MPGGDPYHSFTTIDLPERSLVVKPGVRGHPGLAPGAAFLRSELNAESGRWVDATATAGAVASRLVAAGCQVTVLEPSRAALRCLERGFSTDEVEIRAGLAWDLPQGEAERIVLAPPTDRGTARVVAELDAAARSLAADGALYLALHKDEGAKRYERLAGERFSETRILSRQRGWRLLEACRPRPVDPPSPIAFEAVGMRLEAYPGVFAAGRLDRGTALLVEAVEWGRLSGADVLDLGCGYGVLALLAARHGARAVGVDDDLAAVRSGEGNARALGGAAQFIHSDVDSALGDALFDVVLVNPPFHVGRGVRMEVPHAFLRAAQRRLRPGGELWLVANRALPYEAELASWGEQRQLADEAGFKVIHARR